MILIFTSCVGTLPSPEERKNKAVSMMKNEGFTQFDIKTSTFTLFSLQNDKNNCENKNLKIYIEGDGLSWINKNTISQDPSPINLLILKLMNEDNNTCKVYLARPCQFVSSDLCHNKYWTSARFSEEVIKSYEDSLKKLKEKYNNKSFTLIGYSGGGAIATLLAAKKNNDVKRLITIAGNLDTNKWTSFHKVSNLENSLNPSDYTNKLENIEQFHLIGEKDKIIPKDIFLSYFSKFEKKDKIKYILVDASHSCCWEKSYKSLLNSLD